MTLIGVVAVAVVALRQGYSAESGPQYSLERVTRGDVVQSVNAVGQLSPLVSVEVSSQISGLVTEVNVDFNTAVKRGQVLARMDPSTYAQRLVQAEADMKAAEAAHELASVRLRRLNTLRQQDLITLQDYDEARAGLEQSRASLETTKAAVENARVDLQRCTIKSPIDGIVIFRQVEVGKTIVSSLSAPTLFTIAQDLSKMRIVAPVSEVDVGLVVPGQAVMFKIDAFGDRRFEGRLVQIRNPYIPTDRQSLQPTSQDAIATFDAVIEVENSDLLLRPSLTAIVAIVVNRRAGVLRVPNRALRVVPTSSVQNLGARSGSVYRLPVGDKSAAPALVNLHLGISDSDFTEVLGGLSDGDMVVVEKTALAAGS